MGRQYQLMKEPTPLLVLAEGNYVVLICRIKVDPDITIPYRNEANVKRSKAGCVDMDKVSFQAS